MNTKTNAKSDTRGLFFVLTLSITLIAYGIIYHMYGHELIENIFDLTDIDKQWVTLPFYPIRFGNSAGYIGLLCASLIPQLIYNIFVCANDELKAYKYIISLLIAAIGVGAYIFVLCCLSIIISIVVFIGLLILVFAAIIGS